MPDYDDLLSGGDLRSIGNSNLVAANVQNEDDFGVLFKYLLHPDRQVVMRAADAIEKITTRHPEYLHQHRTDLFDLCRSATNKELQWHLALLIPRLDLEGWALENGWTILLTWAKDQNNSRIVRVNSLQGLFEMSRQNKKWTENFNALLRELEQENIPSFNARIRKIRKQIERTAQ